MMNCTHKITTFNLRYFLFFIAALSLLFSGIISNNKIEIYETTYLSLFTIIGIFWVYKLNDAIESKKSIASNLAIFFSNKLILICSLLIVSLIVFGPLIVNSFRFKYLAFSGILGALYSFQFKIKNWQYRLKNIVIIKNIAIGIGWGLLIPIGSGSFENVLTYYIMFFSILQVFIGSMIRDIPDQKRDSLQKVNSFPVVFGKFITLIFLGVTNLIPLIYISFYQTSRSFIFLVILVCSWRFVNLICIYKNPESKFWLQTGNLLTCLLIFITLLIGKIWIS